MAKSQPIIAAIVGSLQRLAADADKSPERADQDIRTLREQLPQGFTEAVISWEASNDFSVIKPFLQIVEALAGMRLAHLNSMNADLRARLSGSWPSIFESGEAAGVGPSLFALVPLLARAALEPLHRLIMRLCQQLLLMLSKKDPWALFAYFEDAVQLFFIACRGEASSTIQCFTRFASEFNTMDPQLEAYVCAISLGDNDSQLLVAAATRELSEFILRTMGQMFSDSVEEMTWKMLCDQVVWAASCEKDAVLNLSICLLEGFCEALSVPDSASEHVGHTLLYIAQHRTSAQACIVDPPLTGCLATLYQDLPHTVIELQAENLLAAAESRLCDPDSAPGLQVALCNCIRLTLPFCASPVSRAVPLLRAASGMSCQLQSSTSWSSPLSSSPLPRSVVVDADARVSATLGLANCELKEAMVALLREMVRQARGSRAHARAAADAVRRQALSWRGQTGAGDLPEKAGRKRAREDACTSNQLCSSAGPSSTKANASKRTTGKGHGGATGQSRVTATEAAAESSATRIGEGAETAPGAAIMDEHSAFDNVPGSWLLESELVRTATAACSIALAPMMSSNPPCASTDPSRGAAISPPPPQQQLPTLGRDCDGAAQALGMLETVVCVLDLATEVSVWDQTLGFVAGLCTIDKVPALIQHGLLYSVLQIVEEAGRMLIARNCSSSANPIDTSTLAAILANVAGFIVQQRGPPEAVLLPDTVTCAFIKASSCVPTVCMPARLDEILHLSLQPTGTIMYCMSSERSFVRCHFCQVASEQADWISMMHRLVASDETTTQMASLVPGAIADLCCAWCCRNPRSSVSQLRDEHSGRDTISREPQCCGCIRCDGTAELEDMAYLAESTSLNRNSSCFNTSCSPLTLCLSKDIFDVLHRLIHTRARNETIVLAVLEAFPIFLLHANKASLQNEGQFFRRIFSLVIADDTAPAVRCAAARAIGALAHAEGIGLMAMESASTLEASVNAFRRELEDVWARGEPSDEKVSSKMEGCFMALGFVASGLLADARDQHGSGNSGTILRSSRQAERISLIVPLIIDLVINCASCHVREHHRLVDIAYRSVDRIGRAMGGDVFTVVEDRIIKRHIFLKIVSIMRENDLLFMGFFAVFHSVVKSDELKEKLQNEIAPCVIPELIVQKDEELVGMLAAAASQPTEELVIFVFASIMTHLFLLREDRRNPDVFNSAVELAFQMCLLESAEDRSTIIGLSSCETIDMVVWEVCLYENDSDIRHGRLVLSKICRFYCDPNSDVSMGETDSEPALEVLMRHENFKYYYSRLLHHYYSKYFKSKDSSVLDQLRALKVVNYTIPLVGSFLDEHYTYLESIIRSAQSIASLRELVCEVWCTLIYSLGPTSLQIKTNLTQIVVNLLGLGDSFPKLVAPSINFLLVKHKAALGKLITLIPRVQSQQPQLQDASKTLQKQYESMTLLELIDRHLHGIECSDDVVQVYALSELRQTLRAHRQTIAGVFMGDQASGIPTLAAEVKKLISALLRLSTLNGRMDIRVMSSECLGEIGAIDPARIGELRRVQETFGSRSHDDLAIEIICSHLVRILKRGGTRAVASGTAKTHQARVTIFERVHFAIQELLRFLNCNISEVSEVQCMPSRSGGFSQHPRNIPDVRGANARGIAASADEVARGRRNWMQLPREVQQVVKPFLAGKLIFNDKSSSEPLKTALPIYRRGVRLHMWACAFQRELIAKMDDKRAAIFRVVKPLLKYDSILSVFLLQYTVFDVVCHGSSEDRDLVKQEMLHVLQETRTIEDEIDQGTIVSVYEQRQFKVISSQQNMLQPADFVGKIMKIGMESRRITKADAAGHLTVDKPFPAESIHGKDASQSYCVCSVSNLSTATSGAVADDTPEACGGTTITQQVFGLIESFARWHEQTSSTIKKSQSPTGANAGTSGASPQQLEKLANVSSFLSNIPKRILAETSYRCGAYDRALLYLETSVRETWKAAHIKGHRLPPPLEKRCDVETVKLLQRIHAGLDDVDGLMGVAKLRGKSTLEEQVLDSEIAGDWTAALACYEQASQEEPGTMRNHMGLLRCLRNLGHMQTMLTHAEGCMNRYPQEAAQFRNSAVQAAWRLGRWDLVDELTKTNNAGDGKGTSFDFNLSHALLMMKARDQSEFSKHIRQARIAVLEPLAAASMESYSRAYPLLVRLQMISELQQMGEILVQNDQIAETTRDRAQEVMQDWDIRLQLTQPSLLGREPLLALRRVLFELLDMKDEVANGWVQFARAARCAGHDRTAQSAIMQADRYGASRAHIERAKLKWNCPSERHESLRVLRDYLDRHRGILRGDEKIYTKTLVLYWRWVQEMGLRQTCDVAEKFQEEMSDVDGTVLCKGTEKTHFLLGHFYDIQVFPDRNTGSRYSDTGASTLVANPQMAKYLPAVLHHYAQSLLHGYKHIFQSLPRLLTLWFENFETLRPDDQRKANTTLRMLKDRLPPYIWLTVFSQLISRICHSNADVLGCLKDIIAKVLHKHPKQALWSLVAVLKSGQPMRFNNAKDIRERAAQLADACRDSAARKAMDDFLGRLVEELIKVCNLASTISGGGSSGKAPKTLSMAKNCRSLAQLGQLDNVIVPLQSLLTPTLPAAGVYNASHNPFPATLVTLRGFGDRIDVMSSLMCPVVVRFLGSDGGEYRFLCKPKDDLRKDSRMMDFNIMINRLLAKDADARRRNIYIRTFSVIPLNENNGLIQWVNDTTVLREILNELYGRELGPNSYRTSRIQDMYTKELKPRGSRGLVEFYEEVLLPQFPPVLHKWLLEKFPAPAQWIAARNAYTRTLAAWSMVGYVVGLGDRHAENIMFDATNGDCVHVDFACLFNKGEALAVPERVPFRLTPNLLDPLGVCGHEGGFTHVCRVAMAVLRANKDALMNVLETFLHDPLVEWSKRPDEAQRILSKCERRLRGEVTRFPADRDIRQVLSVDGQVRAVIAEATSSDNLANMYRWWMPWY